MSEFINAVSEFAFLRHAIAAGLLAGVACGVVGTFVVTRRITYLAGSIAHFVLGGMGVARYFNIVYGFKAVTPMVGATAAALSAALIIGFVRLRSKEREDTVIGALWAVGMATGIIFISRTPGYNEDLMSYLFGNILLVNPGDLWLIGCLDVVILFVTFLYYHQLVAICFDEEYARLRGVPVETFYLVLLCLTALTVVVLVTVVGVVMVIALLTLPAAVASRVSRRMWQMILLSTFLVAALTVGGLAVAYEPDLPAGATIVVLAGALYLAVVLVQNGWRRLRALAG